MKIRGKNEWKIEMRENDNVWKNAWKWKCLEMRMRGNKHTWKNYRGSSWRSSLSSSGNGVSFPPNTHNMEVGGALTLVYHIDIYIYI